MQDVATIAALSHEELVALVLKLINRVEQLERENRQLREEIDELKRKGKRQAAPFSKNQSVPDPKPAGRKSGSGRFERRAAPDPESYSQPPISVHVGQNACPSCGGDLRADGSEIVTITDAPAAPPVVTAYEIEICRCQTCGKRVRGQHPEIAPDQFGATAHRLGVRVMAIAAWLHYGVGIPVRRVPSVLGELCGVDVTQSALTQDALTRARMAVGAAHTQIRTDIATREHLHADDTGWRIFGASAWLMGFSSEQETYFQIRSNHGSAEVTEVVSASYRGVLHTDRFRSYDAETLSRVPQQKCLAHVIRNLDEAIAAQSGRARALPMALRDLLRSAIDLWHQRDQLKDFRKRADDIADSVAHLLRERSLRSRINTRLVAELGWHDDRGNLLRFLKEPHRCEPTNNEAERALRPAVIARKVSQCSKTDAGADAHASFTSVIATAIKRGATSVVDALCRIFATGEIPASFAD